MKTCSRCKKSKSESAFSKRTASKDGLCSRCKTCDRDYNMTDHFKAELYKNANDDMRLYYLSDEHDCELIGNGCKVKLRADMQP
jgi:hypothetical protein